MPRCARIAVAGILWHRSDARRLMYLQGFSEDMPGNSDDIAGTE